MKPYYKDQWCQLYHGDNRHILAELGDQSIDLVLTDPPYGIDHDTDYTRFTGGVSASCGTHTAIAGDDEPFDPAWMIERWPNVVLFGANCFSSRLPQGSWLIWDKRMPRGENLLSDGEAAWWSRGHGVYIYSHMWNGFRRASERRTKFHPSQKPVAVMCWILNKASKPGDTTLDPYCGAGATLLAAKKLGRRAIGIEINERYCEIAARRLSQDCMNLEVV